MAAAKTSIQAKAIVFAAIAVGVTLFVLPLLTPVAHPVQLRTAGAVAIAISLFATGIVPPQFGSLLFMFLGVALALAPAKTVFSGFASGAVWLVFGGIILGQGVQKSGLGDRAVRRMLLLAPKTFGGLVWALTLTGAGLAWFIPSAMGRVVLLLPLVLALAERLGFAPGTKGRTGLVLAATLGTMIPAFGILPSNVPNPVMIGAAEALYGTVFSYGRYLLLNYPVMSLSALVILPTLIIRLFRDIPRPIEDSEERKPWTGAEKRLSVIMVLALGLWITDIFHGISPAWVAMGAALLCVMPGIGLLPPASLTKDVDYGPWLFVAGVIGLGAVVTETGLGNAIADAMFSAVGLAGHDAPVTFGIIYAVGFTVALVTTLPASPGILTPLAQGISQATGWPLESVMMAQVPVWMVFAFPYQAPPIVVAMALGGVRFGQALKLLAIYAAIGILVILPLQYLWGRFLGVYP